MEIGLFRAHKKNKQKNPKKGTAEPKHPQRKHALHKVLNVNERF